MKNDHFAQLVKQLQAEEDGEPLSVKDIFEAMGMMDPVVGIYSELYDSGVIGIEEALLRSISHLSLIAKQGAQQNAYLCDKIRMIHDSGLRVINVN